MFRFKRTNTIPDAELIACYRSTGDNYHVGELFKRYSHLVFAVSMKYLKDEDESKDAVMQIFEKLLVDLKKYEVANFKSWLHSIARNHCLMKLRAGQSLLLKNEELKKDTELFMEMDVESHQSVESENEMLMLSLGDGVKQLNEEQKVCVELFYLQEKSYAEVSEITGFSMMQVKSYIQNGKRNLKNYILSRNEQQVR